MPVRTEKKRYVAFDVRASEDISKDELQDSLRKTVRSNSLIKDFRIISYNRSKNILIIRCGHRHVETLKKKLNDIKINELSVQNKVLLISGTLKTLRKKLGFLLS